MDREERISSVRQRRPTRLVGRLLRILRALGAYVRDALSDDILYLWKHKRLYVGSTFVIVGIFSFASDRYCDGNSSSYYACTSSATYYYYPWWAIVLIVLGSHLVVTWVLRRKR